MADTRDIEIEIYGEIKDFETIKALAAEMNDHVAPEFGESYLDEIDAVQHIVECIEGGKPIRVVREETGEDLDGIAAVCQEHGLAYCIEIHRSEFTQAGMWTWAPGFEKVESPDFDEKVVLDYEEYRKLWVAGDMAGIQAKMDEMDRITLRNVRKKVTASEDVLESAREYEGDDEMTP